MIPSIQQRDLRILVISNLLVQRSSNLVSEKHKCQRLHSALVDQTRAQELERLIGVKYTLQREEDAIEKKWKIISRNLTSYHPVWARGVENVLRADVDEDAPQLPEQPNVEQKVFWKLDKTEFGSRMRCKLKRNYCGSRHEEASHQHWSQVSFFFLFSININKKWKAKREEEEKQRIQLMAISSASSEAKNPGIAMVCIRALLQLTQPR